MKKYFLIPAIAAQLARAHYTFPDLYVNSTVSTDWEYVRITSNHYSQAPVTDVTSSAIRCYELDDTVAASTSIATVAAGSTVGFKADNSMGHPGYFSAYLSSASPSANSNQAGLGKTWWALHVLLFIVSLSYSRFKIWEWSPTYSASTGLVFNSESE
ncbi:hypothetical protein H0H93_014221 [Arthromyces matolae]|nr:hypothetical protein H0H93_014221 [Arthromyces matolae]